jgi:3-dehydroquinate dehydratase II
VKVGVVHGPNLRLLGRREPGHYGLHSLEDIDAALETLARELSVDLEIFQSNHEGEILDWMEAMSERVDGFLINPAALTHTSVGLRDALLGMGLPFVEVHVSNTQARESFRKRSCLSDVSDGVVFGFGAVGYLLGLRGLAARLHAPGGL